MVQTFTITPMVQPLFVRSGDVIIRRYISNLGYRNVDTTEVTVSHSRGLIRMPKPMEGILRSSSFDNDEGLGFTINIVRLEPIAHSHEDSIPGRNCGRLGFRFNPFSLFGKGTREFIELTKEEESMKPLAKEKMNLRFFNNIEEARLHGFLNWRDMACGHEMAVPRDEWKLSIIGLADVYISVERMFLDEYDIDDDSDNDQSHPFVDVLDFVITKNTIKYNAVEENRVDGDRVEGAEDKEKVDMKVIGEGDADADAEDRAGGGEKVHGEVTGGNAKGSESKDGRECDDIPYPPA
ncbi:hypothetical protein F4782DRAFT_390024 [Xylaria castorea]|nr:hypothetical protein F4782DRAFT_390024 [Xylaria castorea]